MNNSDILAKRKYNYRAEYSKSNRSKCKNCKTLIDKDVLRMIHLVKSRHFDGHEERKYHLGCFFEKYHPASEAKIDSFGRLQIKDQEKIRKLIDHKKSLKRAHSSSTIDSGDTEPPKKKSKNDTEEKLEALICRQNKEFHELRKTISSLHTHWQTIILKDNNQKVPRKKEAILNHVTDILYFGAIEPCTAENCKKGNFVFDGNYAYRCFGYLSGYGKCNKSMVEPVRRPVQISDLLRRECPFLNEDFTVQHRAVKIPPARKSNAKQSTKDMPIAVYKEVTLKDGIAVEVDPKSGLQDKAHIYVKEGKIYSAILDKVDLDPNLDKNSHYKQQLLESDAKNPQRYWIYLSWGRVGENRGKYSCKEYNDLQQAISAFDKIFFKRTFNSFNKETFTKYLGRYHKLESTDNLVPKAYKTAQSLALVEPVQNLMKLLMSKEMINDFLVKFHLDITKMPLGKIDRKQIAAAFSILQEIEMKINTGATRDALEEFSNRFYSLIPHKISYKDTLVSVEELKEKAKLLYSLNNINFTYSFLYKETRENADDFLNDFYLNLNVKIEPLAKHSSIFAMIAKQINDTKEDYNVEIEDVFKVSRKGELSSDLNNKRLLYHGTRITNIASILKNGLMIAHPEAYVIGCLFGKGHYFSDVAANSIQYCYANQTKNIGLVLVCEVALGDSVKCYDPGDMEQLPDGKHSVHGVGKFSPETTTLSDGTIIPHGKPIEDENLTTCIEYNEFVVYKNEQVKIKYLVKFTQPNTRF